MTQNSKMMHRWTAAGIVLIAGLFATAAHAEPRAIVEDIDAAGSRFAFMDYVEQGDVVRLSAGERLVLGYFSSCMQETIIGGTITIGLGESDVTGGQVQRERVACDGGQVELGKGQANNSGVVAFRGGTDKSAAALRPEVTLYGRSPLFRSTLAGTLVIERVDQPDTPVEIDIRRGANDMAKRDIALVAGGIYRARLSAGSERRELIFDVDAFAEAGDQPKLSRLIRF